MSTPNSGIGWKQQGNSAYEPLLALRTVYEFAEEDYDDYRVERQRIMDAIPREAEGSIVDGDIVLHAHLFNGSWDWYVAGYDPDEDIAFGYVMGLENEWGRLLAPRGGDHTLLPAREHERRPHDPHSGTADGVRHLLVPHHLR